MRSSRIATSFERLFENFSRTISDFFSGPAAADTEVGGNFEDVFELLGNGDDGLGLAGRFCTVFDATVLGVVLPPRLVLIVLLLLGAADFVGEGLLRGERDDGVFVLDPGSFFPGATVFRPGRSVSDGARCRLRELKAIELSYPSSLVPPRDLLFSSSSARASSIACGSVGLSNGGSGGSGGVAGAAWGGGR